MVTNISRGHNQTLTIVEALLTNPRASIRKLSTQLNLEYNSVRRLVKTLFSKKQIVPAIALPANILGREAAFIKIKGSNLEKITYFSLYCNHVITYIEGNNGKEAIVVIAAENKQKIVKFIEILRSLVNDISEIIIEYGVLPGETLLLVKNTCSKCGYFDICSNNTLSTLARNNKRNNKRAKNILH
jgi:DNA-binding Lrp family transcriptional regulator